MGVKVKCLICGKEEEVIPARAKKYKTCSRQCVSIYNSMRTSKKITKTCTVCGKEYKVKRKDVERSKYCSIECKREAFKEKYSGEGNPNYGNRKEKCVAWKGGKRISNYGYVLLFMPEHPNARSDGYILEHRYVMSQYLGRPLRDDEIVHHKDGNKLNNNIENLELTTLSEHTSIHNQEKEIIRDEKGRIFAIRRKGKDEFAKTV